jgi:phage gp29-like protein
MVETTRILDQHGNPIKRTELQEPQTSKLAQLHREFASHPSRGLTPLKLARILEAAEQGDIRAQHELFMDMEEKDTHIFAEMGKRKRALLTVEWDIVPPRNASATERKLAGYAKELMQDVPNFEDVILDALDGIGHGYSCQEIEWELIGREWMPKEISHRPQGWFQTDMATRTEIRLRDNSLDGEALRPFGWIRHVHKAKSGYIARSGLHRVLSWPYLFKNYSVGDLAEFLEIYGLPLRLGTYQSGASDDEKATLLRAVMSIGHDAAGIIPEGMMIEFKEAAKGSEGPFMAMTDWCEKSQSKAILGGTLTSQADGKSSTNALGNVHNEVREDLMRADAVQLAGTLTRDLVYPLLALNKGGVDDLRRLPKFKFVFDDSEDLGVLAEALPKLVGLGMNIPLDWAHERAGIPQAEEGAAVLGEEKPAAGPGVAANASLAALSATGADTFADQTALDAMIESIAPDLLQGQAAATLKPVLEMIAASADYAEIHGKLAEIFPSMNTQQLEETLARAMFVAEVWGRLSAQDEQG